MKEFNKLKIIKQQQIENGIDPCARPEPKVVASGIGQLSDYQSAMQVDLAKISAEKTLDGKARVKKLVLPNYLDFVSNYIEQEHDYPNDVAVQVMIWLLDTGDIETGLNLALHLIRQGQKMPKKFDRDMPTFICDFLYDWAAELLRQAQGANPYLQQVVDAMDAEDWDVHPLCKSKLYVMLAKHLERTGEYAAALALCEKAEAVNPEKAGVKTMKERLTKLLNK